MADAKSCGPGSTCSMSVTMRLDTLDAAIGAYDVYLRLPREPGHVLMIRQKTRVLRRSDRPTPPV